MKYGEICVMTTTHAAEAVAEILTDVTGQAVSITDKRDLLESNWDYADDGLLENYPTETAVKGFFSPEQQDTVKAEVEARLAELKKYLENCGSLDMTFAFGDDGEWLENWRKNFKPMDFGKLVICPVWLESDTKKPVLKLNSGIAFGTGTHETTAMCVNLMQKADIKGKIFIDVGCGSGILGLAALLLGAKKAVLVDYDEQAVDAARENAALNGLEGKCEFVTGDLCDGVKTRGMVAANLTADILARLAPQLGRVTLPCGDVVVSGILKDRLERTLKLFEDAGFSVKETMTQGEWSAALLVAPKN